MRGNSYSAEIQTQAERMRSRGCTYNEIHAATGVPKSTLATWLAHSTHNNFTKDAQKKHLARIQPLAAAARRRQREERLTAVAQTARCSLKDSPTNHPVFKKSLLAMLYWAEGSKYKGVSGLRFINTDPELLHLYITLLRLCYEIDSTRLGVRLHLHPIHNETEAKRFWRKTLSIPSSVPIAITHKERSAKRKFRENYMGACYLFYPDSAAREELLAIGKELNSLYKKSAS